MRPTGFRLHWLYYASAVAALAFAGVSVTTSAPKPERREPQGAISAPEFSAFIAATGIVEPASQIVTVTPDIDGVVARVFVEAGDRVNQGDALFALDDGRALADVKRAEARLARTRAEIKLRQAEARAAFARAEAARLEAARLHSSVERFRPLRQEAISEEQFDQMSADAEAAAFSWRSMRESANAADATAAAASEEYAVAEAELGEATAALRRTVMRAPLAGSVLRVDARAGEAVRAGNAAPPGVAVGDIDTLRLRVEIDEANAPYFTTQARAEAALRGAPGARIGLRLVSADKMLKPRASFRDASIEPVDSRVLEVRYEIAISDAPLYAGQLLDVYIERNRPSPREPHRISALIQADGAQTGLRP
ncbi:MAG: biotin/lipoyl-binding protein [Parvularculaceae bacterium]|nr:biotin/lipoyl-binding protein [Parvularculaceae bacterium]